MFLQAKTERFSLLLCCVLLLGFLGASLLSYWMSVRIVRDSIGSQELPLTGDTVYSELQKDIIRPIHLSADMAHNTFLRDWLLSGEQDTETVTRYLAEVKEKNQTVTAFLVSESSRRYYHSQGILKTVSESQPRDQWYFRVRDMSTEYETNVDPDLANMDTTTVFINYRVNDYAGNFIGAVGVGLTLDKVQSQLSDYERRFGNLVYFVDAAGQVTLASGNTDVHAGSIVDAPGIRDIARAVLRGASHEQSLEYRNTDGDTVQVNSRYVPELNWYLILEKSDLAAVTPFRKILALNLVISALALAVILAIVIPAFRNHQRSLKDAAYTDTLTGLLNRQGLQTHADAVLTERGKWEQACSLVYFDIDNFKRINDTFGHASGDAVLNKVARLSTSVMRPEDHLARWGGEEFVVLLPDCDLHEATLIAERIRQAVAGHAFQFSDQRVTVSLGVAERSSLESLDEVLFRADTALYAAKSRGKNRVVQAEYADGSLTSDSVADVAVARLDS